MKDKAYRATPIGARGRALPAQAQWADASENTLLSYESTLVEAGVRLRPSRARRSHARGSARLPRRALGRLGGGDPPAAPRRVQELLRLLRRGAGARGQPGRDGEAAEEDGRGSQRLRRRRHRAATGGAADASRPDLRAAARAARATQERATPDPDRRLQPHPGHGPGPREGRAHPHGAARLPDAHRPTIEVYIVGRGSREYLLYRQAATALQPLSSRRRASLVQAGARAWRAFPRRSRCTRCGTRPRTTCGARRATSCTRSSCCGIARSARPRRICIRRWTI